MAFSTSLSKFLILIFNLIFVVLGIVLISYGFILLGDLKVFEKVMQPSSQLAVSIIFLGLVVFLISFFGCCGAWKESYCLLYTYGTIVFFVLILELVAAGFTYKYRHQIHDSVDDVLRTWIDEYNQQNGTIHEDMDNTQWDLKCCGASSPSDWLNSTLNHYPLSCCPKEEKITTCDKPFEIGCTDALFEGLRKSSAVVIGVAITVAIIELLAVIMSCSLASSFKKQYEFV